MNDLKCRGFGDRFDLPIRDAHPRDSHGTDRSPPADTPGSMRVANVTHHRQRSAGESPTRLPGARLGPIRGAAPKVADNYASSFIFVASSTSNAVTPPAS